MTRRRYELTNREWAIIVLLPNKPRGVPRVDDRRVLNGILWQFHDACEAEALIDTNPEGATLLGDKGYGSNTIREKAAARNIWANIPNRSNRKQPFGFSPWLYRQRNLVERFFNRIKQFRGIAMRYDRCLENYLAAVKLVCIRIWCPA